LFELISTGVKVFIGLDSTDDPRKRVFIVVLRARDRLIKVVAMRARLRIIRM